jgi:hypothetical protein
MNEVDAPVPLHRECGRTEKLYRRAGEKVYRLVGG